MDSSSSPSSFSAEECRARLLAVRQPPLYCCHCHCHYLCLCQRGDSERSPCDQQATCKTDQPRVITTFAPTSSPRRIVPPRAMLEPSPGYSCLGDRPDKKKATVPARTCPVSHALPFLPFSRSGQQFAAPVWARCTPITPAPPRSLHAVLMSWHCCCHLSSIPANTLVHVQPCYPR